MFDIGIWELALIGVLALIVLGPERLPEAARFAGRWVARIRNFISSVKDDFDEQLKSEELAELRKLKEELQAARENLTQTTADISSDLASINPDNNAIGNTVDGDVSHEEHDFLLDAIEESGTQQAVQDDEQADEGKAKTKKKSRKKKTAKKAAKKSTGTKKNA